VRAKLILLGVAAAALLAAGIWLWRMARSGPVKPPVASGEPAPPPAADTPPPRRPPPATAAIDAGVAPEGDPPTPPPPPRREPGDRPRPAIVLGRLRDAVKRTDGAVTACITGKVTGRALVQFTAVPVDGRVSIEHAEVIPNVGKERTTIEDRTLLDCLAKAAAGTPLTDVGAMPVIIRTRIVIDDGQLSENWVVSASPQARGDD
jgi:hypothetical protein